MSLSRHVAVPTAAALLVGVVPAMGLLAPARAATYTPSECVVKDATNLSCSATFTEAAEHPFTIPTDALPASLRATAVGGHGFGDVQGQGAAVSGALAGVGPGDTVYAEVGGHGEVGTGQAFNGGGAAGDLQPESPNGGGGGGASDVRTSPRADGLSPDPRLIVAGGGGGRGSSFWGGNAGGYGGADEVNGAPGTDVGGHGGGGPFPGGDGALGQGGSGSNTFGAAGGGGGGWYGGGGAGEYGGGGGGSSYADGALVPNPQLDATGIPSVMISWDVTWTSSDLQVASADALPAGAGAAVTPTLSTAGSGTADVSSSPLTEIDIAPVSGGAVQVGASCSAAPATSAWTCSAHTAGTYEVSFVWDGTVLQTKALTVVPDVEASLTLSPEAATIPVGSSQAYTAQSLDAFGNVIANADVAYSIADAGGGPSTACPGGECTPEALGDYIVTAQGAVASDTSTLHVRPLNTPSIFATVTSAQPKSKHGWYRTPVTVTFTCSAPDEATLQCPMPVQLTKSGRYHPLGAGSTSEGGASVMVQVDLDLQRPTVKTSGVRSGATYAAAPKIGCVSTDSLSGIASCKVTRSGANGRTSYRATATDKAGNTRSVSGFYRLDPVRITGLKKHRGAYDVASGDVYRLVVLSNGPAPVYYWAARAPGQPTLGASRFSPAGREKGVRRWTQAVRMGPGMAAGTTWNLGVRIGTVMHVIKVRVH